MIILLSPSKTMDFKPSIRVQETAIPLFVDRANNLVKKIKGLTIKELRIMLGTSETIARQTFDRYRAWEPNHTAQNSKIAMLAFKGDVYQGLEADSLSDDEMNLASKHLRMLSGLYGILRPFDLIQPHRLEMGTLLKIAKARNLYEYWKKSITSQILLELKMQNSSTIVDLASKEYSDSVDFAKLKANVIQPVFMDFSTGKYRVITYYAKRTRGLMTRFILKNNIQTSEEIKLFNLDGYLFNSIMSNNQKWVFTRG
jgi:uncharacterized protein